MSKGQLPEEILREILCPLFAIDPKDFFTFPDTGQPRWTSQKPSQRRREPGEIPCRELLLVSRRWLCVCTQLLYEAVMLWESTHSKVVAQVLKAHPEVGKRVRYLRIEGWAGIWR